VVVDNVGTVHEGNNLFAACKAYGEYRRLSEAGSGRAGGAAVVLFDDGEPKYEHRPGRPAAPKSALDVLAGFLDRSPPEAP
jgi:hypothetical protein